MKIEITCFDAICLVQLIELLHLVNDPEFVSFRKRILVALSDAGFRPLNENDILLPIKVDDNV